MLLQQPLLAISPMALFGLGADTMSGISKRISGSWVSGDYGIMKTDTDTITTLPAVLYPNDTIATVGLKGQMEQSGTPTPTAPIQPQSCGERTGNLFDESTLLNGFYDPNSFQYYPNDNYRCFHLLLQAGTYTILAKSDILTIRLLRVSSASLGTNSLNRDNQSYTFTLPATETIYVSLRNSTTTNDFAGLTIMLNTGSQPLPYEPYGQYKIPILNNSQTTNVYLGEVQSTRIIKKYEFTGDEAWGRNSGNSVLYLAISDGAGGNAITSMCTEYPAIVNVSAYANMADKSICIKADGSAVWIKDTDISSATDFKTHLSQQYAAGTPVTVWYVLATPETGIVNEPLMKIGDYADEVSGITIPTIAGANTIDVDTTLQPSEVSVNYKGWHPVADVHERDNGQWD